MKQKKEIHPALNQEMQFKDFRDTIAPNRVSVKDNYIQLGNNYARTLVVVDYPPEPTANWLQKLYRFKGNITLSYHFEPTSAEQMIKDLDKSIRELNGRLDDPRRTPRARKQDENELKSADRLLDKLIRDKNNHIFMFHMYIHMQAETLEELNKLEAKVKRVCVRTGIKQQVPVDNMLRAFESVLPTGNNRLPEWTFQNMDAEAAAYTFMFDEAEIFEQDGIIKGRNKTTDSIVLLNQYKLMNHNEFVVGRTGAGKTFYLLTDMLRHFMQGYKIMAIDHEGEYAKRFKKIGGQVVTISPMGGSRINPFEVLNAFAVDPVDKEDDEEEMEELSHPSLLHQKISRLKIFFGLIKKNMSELEKALVEDLILETYKYKNIDFDTDFTEKKPEDYPILSDMYEIGMKHNDKRLEDFMAILKTYVTGSNSKIFNGHTNVNLKSDAICFNLKYLEDESDIHQSAMFNVFSFLWDVITEDLSWKRLYVDEAHIMADPNNPRAMRFMFQVYKRIRKYHGGCTVATQQISDYLSAVEGNVNYGKAIIENSMSKMILGMEKMGIESLSNYEVMDLSERERSKLLKAKRGEGIFLVGSNRTHIQVEATPTEMKIIDPAQYRELEVV